MSKLQRNSHKTEKASSLCPYKGVPVKIKSVESQKPWRQQDAFKIGWRRGVNLVIFLTFGTQTSLEIFKNNSKVNIWKPWFKNAINSINS